MSAIRINLDHHSYEVIVASGALERLGEIVRGVAPHDRCGLLADAEAYALHGEGVEASLRAAGYAPVTTTFPSGEEHKTLETVRRLYEPLLAAGLERGSPLVALGGGVAGDAVGFVAATYLRGVPLVQCPTTLLAMVDASVGGKVGVNVPQGKNLIGAFYQPVVVVADPLVLRTLPPGELRSGLAECVKHAMIRDERLFAFLRDEAARIQAIKVQTMAELICRNVAIKGAVVEADEKESGERAHLNFGHTFAHAIEAATGYGRFRHGEAVALGMVAATGLASSLGLCSDTVGRKLGELLGALGLPTTADLPPASTLMESMRLDKKVRGGKLRLVLPTRIGEVVIRDDVSEERVAEAWEIVRSP